jgi:hypothetical protein
VSQALVDAAKVEVPRCLSKEQRYAFGLQKRTSLPLRSGNIWIGSCWSYVAAILGYLSPIPHSFLPTVECVSTPLGSLCCKFSVPPICATHGREPSPIYA